MSQRSIQRVDVQRWSHSHTFGQDKHRLGELRTIIVVVLTSTMMVIEVTTGIVFGSMALLADGLHMASHAAALSINVFAYVFARRYASDTRYSFGTGKINALGGFVGAVLLAVFALVMAWESVSRIIVPVEIAFNRAILVAILGLLVNGVSVFILGHGHDRGHQEKEHDHNLRAAYLHVSADALTSLLAIVALLAAKHLGLVWMDPAMGLVGAALVSRWSLGLLRTTGAVLLDRQGPSHIENAIRESVEDADNRVVDLHLWAVGPNIYAVILSIVSISPMQPDEYKAQIPSDMGLVHVSVEVNHCTAATAEPS